MSHDDSFRGVVTIAAVARLPPRTALSFWACDIGRRPSVTSDLHAYSVFCGTGALRVCMCARVVRSCSDIIACVYLIKVILDAFPGHV